MIFALILGINQDREELFVTGASEDTSSGDLDYLLIAYDVSREEGEALWSTRYDHNGYDDFPALLEVDTEESEIILTGAGGDNDTNWDILTVKFDRLGEVDEETVVTNPGIGFDNPSSLVRDSKKNIYITGAVADSNQFNIQTIKLDSTLSVEWTSIWGDSIYDEKAFDIELGPGEDDLFVIGYDESSIGQDFLVLRYNTGNGTVIKNRTIARDNSSQSGIGKQIARIGDDRLIVTGEIFDNNETNIVTTCLDTSLTAIWQTEYKSDTTPGLLPLNLSVSPYGDFYVQGITIQENISRYTVLHYNVWEINHGYDLDSTENYGHRNNEVVVRFNEEVLDSAGVHNRRLEFGKLNDFVSQELADSMISKMGISESQKDQVGLYKILPAFTPEDTIAVSGITGDSILIGHYWTWFVLTLPEDAPESGWDEERMADSLAVLDTSLAYVAVNHVGNLTASSNDTKYAAEQYSLHPISPYTDASINADGAWDLERGEEFVRVGILDSGLDWKHEDFGGDGTDMFTSKIKGGYDFFANTNLNNLPNNDVEGHGTKVAGIIGALSNNNLGVAGIAGGDMQQSGGGNPGVSLYGYKASTALTALTSEVEYIQAIISASALAPDGQAVCHILNMSNGFINLSVSNPTYDFPMIKRATYDANQAQTTIVAARGNSGDLSNKKLYPACYADNWVMNVGGSGTNGIYTEIGVNDGGDNFSASFGDGLDFIAPSVGLLTPTTESSFALNNYSNFNGTSSSAAHVSGSAALLVSYYNQSTPSADNLAPEDIEHILQMTAINQDGSNPIYDDKNGWGRVDIDAALELLSTHQLIHLEITPTFDAIVVANTDLRVIDPYLTFLPGVYYPGRIDEYQANFSYSYPNQTIVDVWVVNSRSDLWGPYIPTTNGTDISPYSDAILDNSWTSTQATVSGYVCRLNQVPFRTWPSSYQPFSGVSPKVTISLLLTSAPTSIEESASIARNLSIIPNPATSGTIDVEIDGFRASKTENGELRIMDLSGKVVLIESIPPLTRSGYTTTIDIHSLPNGIYFAQYISGEDYLVSKFSKN